LSFGFILPSRARPEGLIKAINSVKKNTLLVKYNFYVYVDDDDIYLHKYQKIHDENREILNLTIGKKIGVPAAFNFLASKVKEDFIMMFNDDLELDTQGWDKIFLDRIGPLEDCVFMAYFNDGINFINHAAFPIISKKYWYDRIGYSSKKLIFQHNDTWIFSIATMLNRCIYFEDIKLIHNHGYSDNKFQDSTFKLNRNRLKILKDHFIFLNLLIERIKKYKLLKKHLKNIEKYDFKDNYKFKVEILNMKEIFIIFLKWFLQK